MKKQLALAVCLGGLLVGGCSSKPSCTSKEAEQILNQIVKDKVKNFSKSKEIGIMDPRPYLSSISDASLDTILSKISISIESIRTINEENKSEVACTGDAHINVPSDALEDANTVQNKLGQQSQMTYNAESLMRKIEYNVQKSDDGKETFLKSRPTDVIGISSVVFIIARNIMIKPAIEDSEKKAEKIGQLVKDYETKRGKNFSPAEAYCIDVYIQQQISETGIYNAYTADDLEKWDKICDSSHDVIYRREHDSGPGTSGLGDPTTNISSDRTGMLIYTK